MFLRLRELSWRCLLGREWSCYSRLFPSVQGSDSSVLYYRELKAEHSLMQTFSSSATSPYVGQETIISLNSSLLTFMIISELLHQNERANSSDNSATVSKCYFLLELWQSGFHGYVTGSCLCPAPLWNLEYFKGNIFRTEACHCCCTGGNPSSIPILWRTLWRHTQDCPLIVV